MRVTVVRDGEPVEVDVDLAAGTVRLRDRTHAVKVAAADGSRVELEIDGERVVLDGWPIGLTQPPADVAVEGESYRARVEVDRRTGTGPSPPVRVPAGPALPGVAPAEPVSDAGEGHAVVPPMPGKVVEVRVKEGEIVRAGQVLLVLEAMKMRNEIVAPVAGRVHALHVSVGANVRARERMVSILPE